MGRAAVAAIVSLWIIPVSIIVNRIVPEPYMDEIFHIPQAQQYCVGNFRNWDPMITTPPGLYVLSLVHAAVLYPVLFLADQASLFSDTCSTVILRSTNCILAVLCSVLFYEIFTMWRPTLDDRRATLYSVILSLYPLHWFFTFLYYTDVASLAAVLSMHLASLKKNYWLSALLGAFAVSMRQTNIIWVLFIACSEVIGIVFSTQRNNARVGYLDSVSMEESQQIGSSYLGTASNLRKRKAIKVEDVAEDTVVASVSTSTCSAGLLDEIKVILSTSWSKKWEILITFSPFFMVLAAFLAFIWWNGSIVLGAKEAHSVSPHFAQLMYFGLISVLATAPVHFNMDGHADLLKSFWKNRPLSFILSFAAIIASFISIHFFSIAHPYLLADNRHYTFYLWRKVIMAHQFMKYLLVPIYVCSWFSLFSMLGRVKRKIWLMVYFIATAAVLVPAPLIEFRYYTIPFYFFMLNSHITNDRGWLLMGLLYLLVNIFTMGMFLFHPFRWDHEPGIQRFIW
ncbi:hypothetical protein SAY87_027898 [Trapa incisa]|uniref:Dol-P-Glc:Glc(2)Man(9)GlcNAc(2)-PP-Dol alpha-1,2-glucosyltransferase n=1 Tax=Trapa incisa TaxID=236973 RepID=A0AAN7QN25_9MYRT|nr:hypothetical protein SAY87_027898 [Trapa incisa]